MKEDEKLRLLDVGSCYNPFAGFDYDITAVDLSPGTLSAAVLSNSCAIPRRLFL